MELVFRSYHECMKGHHAQNVCFHYSGQLKWAGLWLYRHLADFDREV